MKIKYSLISKVRDFIINSTRVIAELKEKCSLLRNKDKGKNLTIEDNLDFVFYKYEVKMYISLI